jgi:hypothetical protein
MFKKIVFLFLILLINMSLYSTEVQPVGAVKDVYGFEELPEKALERYRKISIQEAIKYLNEYIKNPEKYALSAEYRQSNIALMEDTISNAIGYLPYTAHTLTVEEQESPRLLYRNLFKSLRALRYLNPTEPKAQELEEKYIKTIKISAQLLKNLFTKALKQIEFSVD